MRQKTVAILFAFVLFAPSTVFYAWLLFEKAAAQSVASDAIKTTTKNTKERVTFYFSDSQIAELQFVEKDEFLWQGWLYDVISIDDWDGKTRIIAYRDKRETEVRQKLSAFWNIELDLKNVPRNQKVFTPLKLEYRQSEIFKILNFKPNKVTSPSHYNSGYNFETSKKIFHPPKV